MTGKNKLFENNRSFAKDAKREHTPACDKTAPEQQ